MIVFGETFLIIKNYLLHNQPIAQSAGAVEYTDCTSPTSVPDITLNNLMVRLLPSLPGPLWPGVVAPNMGPIYGLNRTKPCFLHYTDFCI